jgi:cell division protein ZapA
MSQREIRVRIFNSEYNLQGEDPAQVQKVADYVDAVMNRINNESPNQTEETIAIVSALNIAEDYFKEKNQKAVIEKDLGSILSECNKKINGISSDIDEIL